MRHDRHPQNAALAAGIVVALGERPATRIEVSRGGGWRRGGPVGGAARRWRPISYSWLTRNDRAVFWTAVWTEASCCRAQVGHTETLFWYLTYAPSNGICTRRESGSPGP